MNEYLSNNKNNKRKCFLILILIITACIIYSYPIYAEQSETSPSLQQISEIIDFYPDISPFQADQLLKEAEKAVQLGISLEDTQEIIQKSLEKKIKAYTIIGIFFSLNELAEDGLPTSPNFLR
jgi:flagellar basal body-associated protein FliL